MRLKPHFLLQTNSEQISFSGSVGSITGLIQTASPQISLVLTYGGPLPGVWTLSGAPSADINTIAASGFAADGFQFQNYTSRRQ